MNCEAARIAMMGLLDGELVAEDEEAVRSHLGECRDCGVEWAKYRSLLALARSAALPEPTDGEVRRFWAGFGNRLERGAGWALLLLGLALLFGYGSTRLALAAGLPLPLRLGLVAVLLGLLLLFLSVLRLRLRTLRFDPYRHVLR